MKDRNEYQRQLYEKRREENVCLWCGKPLDREGSICSECAEKSRTRAKERRDYLLRRGLCPYCGKNKIDPPYKSCTNCREKILRRSKEGRTEKRKQYDSMYRKKKREQYADAGLCTICGKNVPEKGFTTCIECRKKQRKYRKVYVTKYQLSDRDLWKDQGLCARCGSEGLHEGTTLCEKCYENSVKALEKARAVSLGNKYAKRAEREEKEREKERELKQRFKPRTLYEQKKQKGDKNK